MSVALRKGWCPGALRPMEAKDGLLVRLRLTGGILPAAKAQAIADLAERYGNGLFDLTARANLQMRGLRETTLPILQDGLRALDLLDSDAAAESVRNVIASPLAGLHGGLDIRSLVAALERRLVEDDALHALPGKFGFLVDDGSRPSLTDVDADVRFEWDGERFAVCLGGVRAHALQIGYCKGDNLPDRAARIARGFLALAQQNSATRRMRDLTATVDFDGLVACGEFPYPPRLRRDTYAHEREKEGAHTVVGLRSLAGDLPSLGLGAPFGRLDAAMLHAAADLAAATLYRELRLTPWRVILVPGAETAPNTPGFITDPCDPRLAIAACVGATGCAQGTTDTHADAAALAALLPPGNDIALHVSGCEKGCAKASTTAVTLVARDGRYDLVRNGRAGDRPVQRGLDLAAAWRALSAERESA